MKVAGVIAEYNPFHKGHEYHLNKTKQVTEADYVIAVVSGDYVQRGTPSFMNKYIRTRLALLGGAHIVLELPVSYYIGRFFKMYCISTYATENFCPNKVVVVPHPMNAIMAIKIYRFILHLIYIYYNSCPSTKWNCEPLYCLEPLIGSNPQPQSIPISPNIGKNRRTPTPAERLRLNGL